MKQGNGEGKDGGWRERGEAWFNLGRVLHQLGLAHLATGCYWEVLKVCSEKGGMEVDNEDEDEEAERGDLRMEAAYLLQLIYVASGNTQEAKRVTEQYLCI